MSTDHYLRFVQLRREGKIGPIWNVSNGYLLSKQTQLDAMAYYTAEYICCKDLEKLIDDLSEYEAPKKIEPQREWEFYGRKRYGKRQA